MDAQTVSFQRSAQKTANGDLIFNNQPQPHARNGRLLIAAREFLENSQLLPGRNARAGIPDVKAKRAVVHRRIHANLRAGARIFGGIFKQVDQHPFKQRTINVN